MISAFFFDIQREKTSNLYKVNEQKNKILCLNTFYMPSIKSKQLPKYQHQDKKKKRKVYFIFR